jgi:hypothetical protein
LTTASLAVPARSKSLPFETSMAARFTEAGVRESRPRDIFITKESPNYRPE